MRRHQRHILSETSRAAEVSGHLAIPCNYLRAILIIQSLSPIHIIDYYGNWKIQTANTACPAAKWDEVEINICTEYYRN